MYAEDASGARGKGLPERFARRRPGYPTVVREVSPSGRVLRSLGLAAARLTGVGLTSVLIGVLVAGLLAPLVLGLDLGSRAIAEGIRRLPQTLHLEPLPSAAPCSTGAAARWPPSSTRTG